MAPFSMAPFSSENYHHVNMVNMTDSSRLIVTSLRLSFVTFTKVLNHLNPGQAGPQG